MLRSIQKLLTVQKRKEAFAMAAVTDLERGSRQVKTQNPGKFTAGKEEVPLLKETRKQSLANKNESRLKAAKIGILGAKGGVGASTLALNLALSLSKNGNTVTLVDGNLQQPDIAVIFAKQAEHSIVDFLARSQDFDQKVWSACSLPMEQGKMASCRLLSGPADGSAATQANLSQIANSLSCLEDFQDFLLVDLPKNLDKHLVTMLDKLDKIYLIFDGTLACIAAAKRWQKIFAELGYEKEKLVMLHNRAGAKGQDCQHDLPSLLAGHELRKVPNSFVFLEECSTFGEAAVYKNARDIFCKSVAKLADELTEERVGQSEGAGM
ncbi:MAG: P-loop NTPase [Candidatus Obscuribacterales bacterium]|nr:P-loop NTPase [Candidatus Obscuribacterales bacterium]